MWMSPFRLLTSKKYAKKISRKISLTKAIPSRSISPISLKGLKESNETTHFSVMDRYGNVVSNTYTLNFSFGNRHMVPGTGVLLNNEMDDFSSKPGVPNAYGLLGGEANSIEPGKRMLSSMTPTIVFRQGSPYFATGTPGGSRIITSVLQLILNVVDHDMNIAEATMAPRIHHQWFPDHIRVEQGISADTKRLLTARGHEIKEERAMGSVQTVMYESGMFKGFSDLRKLSGSAKGY